MWVLIIAAIVIIVIAIYMKGAKVHRIEYPDGVVIEYKDTPPNFRDAFSDELCMSHSCGTCKLIGNIRSQTPVCTKYGVTYCGNGCLTKTVCDDFQNTLFNFK